MWISILLSFDVEYIRQGSYSLLLFFPQTRASEQLLFCFFFSEFESMIQSCSADTAVGMNLGYRIVPSLSLTREIKKGGDGPSNDTAFQRL